MTPWRSRTLMAIFLAAFCASCRSTVAHSADSIELAKSVVHSHEQFAQAGDLDGVMSNVAEDVVVLSANTPLVKGKSAVRAMYAELLKAGAFEFGHDYEGAVLAGDTVVLHGVARGTFTPVGGQPSAFANNFMLTLKRTAGGRFQLWRMAFAPSGGS